MIGNASFVRKIIYFILIAVLLVPLYLISHPSTRANDGTLDEGGALAKMRIENNLSQANLGEIDPAGASMSLATLGMRGVAANLLWGQAIEYKKTENWDALKATLNQITKLQPNFESVWVFQAWNLSYNVSVEFDDFRQRYHWVKKGISYLIDGTRYNRSMPSLLQEVGWFFQHKLGRADEHRQYRELFRNDKDFHAELDKPDLPINMELTNGAEKKPDNWLVAYEWYRAGERLVETRDAPIRRKNPLLFYSNAAMSLMYYASAIQNEGHLDETSQTAWRRAHEAWKDFGDRGIPSRHGFDIRLNDLKRMREAATSAREKLNALAPGAEERIRAERLAALPKAMQDALQVPLADRTPEQYRLGRRAERQIEVSLAEIALSASAENIGAARRYAKQAHDAESAAETIERERGVINFAYWMTRSESEQTDETLTARRHVYAAEKYFDDTDLENARREYELGFQNWAKVYERFPVLIDDVEAEENFDAVLRYKRLLGRIDEPFPPPGFPLMNLLEYYDDSYLNIVAPEEPQRSDADNDDPDDATAADEVDGLSAEGKPLDAEASAADESYALPFGAAPDESPAGAPEANRLPE